MLGHVKSFNNPKNEKLPCGTNTPAVLQIQHRTRSSLRQAKKQNYFV
jgi:hypothetical protein